MNLRQLWFRWRWGTVTEHVTCLAGDCTPAEIEYLDRRSRVVGYWAYGHFHPDYPYQGQCPATQTNQKGMMLKNTRFNRYLQRLRGCPFCRSELLCQLFVLLGLWALVQLSGRLCSVITLVCALACTASMIRTLWGRHVCCDGPYAGGTR